MTISRHLSVLTYAIAVAAIAVAVLTLDSQRWLSLMTTAQIYAIAGTGLALVYDRTGLLNVAQAASWGAGAFVSVWLITEMGWNVTVAFICGTVAGAVVGAISALPSFRTKGHYLLVVTFVVLVLFGVAVDNLVSLTGGRSGRSFLSTLDVRGIASGPREAVFLVTSIGLVLAAVGYSFVQRSRLGGYLALTRERELLAASLGFHVPTLRVAMFAIGGGFAGFAGVLTAFHLRYISADIFGVAAAITLISVVLVGGPANVWGPLVGSLVLVATPELLGLAPNTAYGVNGAVLALIILVLPAGIVSRMSVARIGQLARSLPSLRLRVEQRTRQRNAADYGLRPDATAAARSRVESGEP